MIILVVNRSIIYYSSILFELQGRSDCSLNQLKKDGCSPYEISGKLKSLVSLLFCYLCLYRTRASSPGCCGERKEKERRVCKYVPVKFEYLHRKSRCEMLIGGNLTARSPKWNWRWNSNFRDACSCKLYFLFPPRRHSAPESLHAG